MFVVPNESPNSILHLKVFFLLDLLRYDDTKAIIVHVSLLINHEEHINRFSAEVYVAQQHILTIRW